MGFCIKGNESEVSQALLCKFVKQLISACLKVWLRKTEVWERLRKSLKISEIIWNVWKDVLFNALKVWKWGIVKSKIHVVWNQIKIWTFTSLGTAPSGVKLWGNLDLSEWTSQGDLPLLDWTSQGDLALSEWNSQGDLALSEWTSQSDLALSEWT